MSIRGLDDCRSRRGIPALPFSRWGVVVRKQLGDKYVEHPKTIGEHLARRRLELGLLQRRVAEIIGVCEDTITYWENGRSTPHVHYYPKIINFLGYVPFSVNAQTLDEKVYIYRLLNGLTQVELARQLRLNKCIICHIEKERGSLIPKNFGKISGIKSRCFLSGLLGCLGVKAGIS